MSNSQFTTVSPEKQLSPAELDEVLGLTPAEPGGPVEPSPLLAAALDWAAKGVPVFPCRPYGSREDGQDASKRPLRGSRGWKDATTDTAQIDAWWTENPHYNVAIYPEPAGLCVIDTDPPVGEENWTALATEHGAAPETRTHLTPRGGHHRLFLGSLPGTASKLGPKVDTRGVASYVLVPPSRTDAGSYSLEHERPYAPLPAWVSERLKSSATTLKAAGDVELDTPEHLDEARHWLKTREPAREGEGGDAYTVQTCFWLRDKFALSEEAMFDVMADWNARCEPPWEEWELRGKCENAWSYAQNEAGAQAGNIERVAKSMGFDLEKITWADYAKTLDEPEAEPAFGSTFGVEPGGKARKYKLFTLAEIRRRPPITWLVPHILPEKALVSIFGFSGAGKTWWALDLAMHLATGKEGYGRPKSEPVDVIYYAGEGATNFGQSRVTAWCKKYGFDPDDRETVRVVVLEQPPELNNEGEFGQLVASIQEEGVRPALIVLDTLARVMSASGWEEDTKGFGLLVNQAERLKRGFGCTVAMLHHTPVEQDDRSRGGGALYAALGAEYRVRGNISKATLDAAQAHVYAVCTKMQDAELDETPIAYRAPRTHGAIVLERITADELTELLARTGKRNDDTLELDIREALEQCAKAGTNKVELPHLADAWVHREETKKRGEGGYTHRTEEQLKEHAIRWKDRVRKAISRGQLNDYLARHPNEEPKKGAKGTYVLTLPPSAPRSSIGLVAE